MLGLPKDHAAVLVNRAREALGNAVRFLMVARRRDHCERLATLVPAGLRALSAEQRSTVDYHMRHCENCQVVARQFTAPAELFGRRPGAGAWRVGALAGSQLAGPTCMATPGPRVGAATAALLAAASRGRRARAGGDRGGGDRDWIRWGSRAHAGSRTAWEHPRPTRLGCHKLGRRSHPDRDPIALSKPERVHRSGTRAGCSDDGLSDRRSTGTVVHRAVGHRLHPTQDGRDFRGQRLGCPRQSDRSNHPERRSFRALKAPGSARLRFPSALRVVSTGSRHSARGSRPRAVPIARPSTTHRSPWK